jgi:hypothetical protein
MCEGGCTNTSDSMTNMSNLTLEIGYLSNKPHVKQEGISYIRNIDTKHMSLDEFISTFYTRNYFEPDPMHTKFEQFEINSKPINLVDHLICAYKEKYGKPVFTYDFIKVVQECGNLTSLKNLVHSVSISRSDIHDFLSRFGYVYNATFTLSVLIHSTVLDTSVMLNIPFKVTPQWSAIKKLAMLKHNMRIAYEPTYNTYTPTEKMEQGLIVAIAGDDESFRNDVNSSSLSPEMKTKLLTDRTHMLHLTEYSGLFPGTPFLERMYETIKTLNEQIESEVKLKGIGGIFLGPHHLVIMTMKEANNLLMAGYGQIWRGKLLAFGASDPTTNTAGAITGAVGGATAALLTSANGCAGGAAVAQAGDVVDGDPPLNAAAGCTAGAIVGSAAVGAAVGTSIGTVTAPITDAITSWF